MKNIQHFLTTNYLIILMAMAILVLSFLFFSSFQKFLVKKGRVKAQLTATLWDDMAIDLLQNVQKYFIVFASIYLSLIWIDFPDRFRLFINKAFILVVLLQAAQSAGILINFWLKNNIKMKAQHDLAVASSFGLISIGVKVIVYTIIFLVALNNLGVNITALIAGLGVGGVAVALALQNILEDLFSSLTIVLDKPFIVGDFIIVNDFMGTVEHIGLKTTRLRSLSGEQLIFGNGDLLQSRIKNYKRMFERRVVQTLTVTYQTQPEMLEKIPEFIREIISLQEDTVFDRCHFLKFQDSALEFELVYWVKNPDFNLYADRAHAINIAIFRKFCQEKIDFAYPTRTLFMRHSEVP